MADFILYLPQLSKLLLSKSFFSLKSEALATNGSVIYMGTGNRKGKKRKEKKILTHINVGFPGIFVVYIYFPRKTY